MASGVLAGADTDVIIAAADESAQDTTHIGGHKNIHTQEFWCSADASWLEPFLPSIFLMSPNSADYIGLYSWTSTATCSHYPTHALTN